MEAQAAEEPVRTKMESLRLTCEREIQIHQQKIDSYASSFRNSLQSIKSRAQQTAQNQGKLGELKAKLREAEDDMVKALAGVQIHGFEIPSKTQEFRNLSLSRTLLLSGLSVSLFLAVTHKLFFPLTLGKATSETKMTNDGRDISIQRKHKREEIEVYEKKAMRFLPLLVEFFVMLVGICSRRKYFVREPLRSEIEEGIYH